MRMKKRYVIELKTYRTIEVEAFSKAEALNDPQIRDAQYEGFGNPKVIEIINLGLRPEPKYKTVDGITWCENCIGNPCECS